MKKKCPQCKLVNYPTADACMRCGSALMRSPERRNAVNTSRSGFARRVAVFFAVCLSAIAGFYLSLVFSAKGLDTTQKQTVGAAIELLDRNGFTREAFLLRRLAVFRS